MALALPLPRVYPILDTAAVSATAVDLLTAARALADGGAAILQWRHKLTLTRQHFADLEALAAFCQQARLPLVINDRADLAQLFSATLHLGQEDLPPTAARQILGPSLAIGLSTHNAEQLAAANQEPVSYHALGPIFGTQSKQRPDPDVGLANLIAWRPLSSRPLVAIGGITLANAPQLLAAGADSVALISALLPPGASATEITERMQQWQAHLQ